MTTCAECQGRGYDAHQQEAWGVWAPCLACDGEREAEDADDRADDRARDNEIREGL